MTPRIKSYASILINLTEANPQETPIQVHKPPPNKRYHSGQEKSLDQSSNIPHDVEDVIAQNTQMTTAVSDTTQRLQTLESKNADAYRTISSMASRIDTQGQSLAQQGQEIKNLGTAFQAQNKLIEAL